MPDPMLLTPAEIEALRAQLEAVYGAPLGQALSRSGLRQARELDNAIYAALPALILAAEMLGEVADALEDANREACSDGCYTHAGDPDPKAHTIACLARRSLLARYHAALPQEARA